MCPRLYLRIPRPRGLCKETGIAGYGGPGVRGVGGGGDEPCRCYGGSRGAGERQSPRSPAFPPSTPHAVHPEAVTERATPRSLWASCLCAWDSLMNGTG